jgi:hypothetical protein
MKRLVATFLVVAAVGAVTVPAIRAQAPADRAKVLRAAVDALGMARYSDIGTTTTRLPAIDIVNTMEFQASGTFERDGKPVKAQFRVALGYNPPALRIETIEGQRRTIQTVRETWAWNESEPGAGLVPGKGTATPMPAAAKERLLGLWLLPYGAIKAALAAGDKAVLSTEAGASVITFPLSGPLAGVTMKMTLDGRNFVTKVETRADDPALTCQVEFSNYADRAEVLTDIKTPGRIIERKGGRTILDLEVKMWETNNPYLVFPVPANVKGTEVVSPSAQRVP